MTLDDNSFKFLIFCRGCADIPHLHHGLEFWCLFNNILPIFLNASKLATLLMILNLEFPEEVDLYSLPTSSINNPQLRIQVRLYY